MAPTPHSVQNEGSPLALRSHILALCCDCEAVDKAADRLFAGQGLSVGLLTSTEDWYDILSQDSSVGEIITVIEDRLRLPFKGGALRLPLGEPQVSHCTVNIKLKKLTFRNKGCLRGA